MWNNRWHKEEELTWYSQIMNYYFEKQLLRLTILWKDDTPISAKSCMFDPANRICNAYLTSYNPDFSNYSPGIVILMEAIKNAIETGCKYYDLTVGEDGYKLSFKPQRIATKNLNISRKGFKLNILNLLKSSK